MISAGNTSAQDLSLVLWTIDPIREAKPNGKPPWRLVMRCSMMPPGSSSWKQEESQVWTAFIKNHAEEHKLAFFVDGRTTCKIHSMAHTHMWVGTNGYIPGQEHLDDSGGVGLTGVSPFIQHCMSCSTTSVLILVDQRGLPYPGPLQVNMLRLRKVEWCAQGHGDRIPPPVWWNLWSLFSRVPHC